MIKNETFIIFLNYHAGCGVPGIEDHPGKRRGNLPGGRNGGAHVPGPGHSPGGCAGPAHGIDADSGHER